MIYIYIDITINDPILYLKLTNCMSSCDLGCPVESTATCRCEACMYTRPDTGEIRENRSDSLCLIEEVLHNKVEIRIPYIR